MQDINTLETGWCCVCCRLRVQADKIKMQVPAGKILVLCQLLAY